MRQRLQNKKNVRRANEVIIIRKSSRVLECVGAGRIIHRIKFLLLPAPSARTEKAWASDAQRPTGDSSFQFSVVSCGAFRIPVILLAIVRERWSISEKKEDDYAGGYEGADEFLNRKIIGEVTLGADRWTVSLDWIYVMIRKLTRGGPRRGHRPVAVSS